MDLEEYRKRVDDAHTFTGIPSYWQELQDAYAEIEHLRAENQMLKDAGYHHMECSSNWGFACQCGWGKAVRGD
jgi:hypothetical protein